MTQSNPGWVSGYTPTPTEWNNSFSAKVDTDGAEINSGVIENTTIGATSPSTGNFTNISVTTQMTLGTGLTRWTSGSDGVTEGGSNTGSNWQLVAYNDAGSVLLTAITVSRATGRIKLILLTDAVNDAAAASGGVAVGELYRNGSIVMQRVA